MSLLLGTIISQPIQSSLTQKFIESLQQIKHYLTLQANIHIQDTQSLLIIQSHRSLPFAQNQQYSTLGISNKFFISKNPIFLFTQYQRFLIENEDDLEFLDICYESLLVLKEYFPKNIRIQVQILEDVMDKEFRLFDFVYNLEREKMEEYTRRVNSSLKSTFIESNKPLTKYQISNILYFCQHYYVYKNKLLALKFLASPKIFLVLFKDLNQHNITFLNELSKDEDFQKNCIIILEKILLAGQIQKQSQYENDKNIYEQSISNSKHQPFNNTEQKQLRRSKVANTYRKPLQTSDIFNKNREYTQAKLQSKTDQYPHYSVKSLLFQLKQSTSLKRLSMLINVTSQMSIQDEKYEQKIDKKIKQICTNFLKNIYTTRFNQKNYQQELFLQEQQQVQKFYQSLVRYFGKKNKYTLSQQYDQSQRKNILEKIARKIEHQYYTEQ